MSTPEEEKEILRSRDRFKGYQLPMIQLDETGPSYYVVEPHPYFYNQPRYWQQEVFEGHPQGGVNDLIQNDIPTTADKPPVIGTSDSSLGEVSDNAPKTPKTPKTPIEPIVPKPNQPSKLYGLLPPDIIV